MLLNGLHHPNKQIEIPSAKKGSVCHFRQILRYFLKLKENNAGDYIAPVVGGNNMSGRCKSRIT